MLPHSLHATFHVCHLPVLSPTCPSAHVLTPSHVSQTPPCIPAATDALNLWPPLMRPQPQPMTSSPHLPAPATTFTSWLPPTRPGPHQCTLAPPSGQQEPTPSSHSLYQKAMPHCPTHPLAHSLSKGTHSALVLICKSNCNCNNNSNQKLDIEGMLS